MNIRGWLVAAAMLVLAFGVLHGIGGTDSRVDDPNDPDVTVETCESLPDYDYERMVARIEEIKGTELRRNVTLCTEQSTAGIDTVPNGGQFLGVGQQGLELFGLDPATSSRRRSSLGHTATPINGGPIEIFLANETVTENVSYISYEGLVAHELSHAIENSHLRFDRNSSTTTVEVRRTTDWTLANRALSEGSAMYVAERYVREYGGKLNVSKLGNDSRGWKHRILVSPYAEGYSYTKNADITSLRDHRVNSTARILHPGRRFDPGTFPARPNLPMDSLERVRTDRVGELFLREALISKGVDAERAAAAAAGWTNDRMDYYRANDSTVVTWRVTWQNASERAEFVATYGTVYDYERATAVQSVDCRDSRRYLVAAGNSATVVECGS